MSFRQTDGQTKRKETSVRVRFVLRNHVLYGLLRRCKVFLFGRLIHCESEVPSNRFCFLFGAREQQKKQGTMSLCTKSCTNDECTSEYGIIDSFSVNCHAFVFVSAQTAFSSFSTYNSTGRVNEQETLARLLNTRKPN